ncbi:MAG: response regulator transcription factor [Clostridium celatum]|nr:response regulator transcription factor [Clostridium celatum]
MINSNYSNISTYKTFDEANEKYFSDKDTIFVYPLIHDSISEIEEIISFKKYNPSSKLLVVDFNKNKDTFFKFSKAGIDGYLLGSFIKEDLIYSLSRLSKGSKFYDREILYFLIDDDSKDSDTSSSSKTTLTNRELEVLINIAHGLSNLEISNKLKISENTVKKHISNIFLKLNVNDRTQATIYAYSHNLVVEELINN